MESKTVIIGAGPAGLTAAYELGKHGHSSLILESDSQVGGLAKTERLDDLRFDLGGHRFFSKSAEIEALWREILGAELLERSRRSRIFYRRRFFDYPIRATNAFRTLGPLESFLCAASYLRARMFPVRPEETFEQWVTNRFGRRLYGMFFKTYTEKVWGIPCTKIGAEWAAQRIANLDLGAVIRRALFPQRQRTKLIKTLIEAFRYPRLGPGQMWEACLEKAQSFGADIRMNRKVVRVEAADGRIVVVEAETADGIRERFPCDTCFSTMPLRDLVFALNPNAPPNVQAAAESLRYRDFITVALEIRREKLFDDNWIYIHSPEVEVCRIQNFKNWSPDLVPGKGRSCLGLEYFVWEGDQLWCQPDEALIDLASREVEILGLAKRDEVTRGKVVRVEKAYPVYDVGYEKRVAIIREHLSQFSNLHCLGRNGQHRYNNQDHSMATALLAARNLIAGETKFDPWAVNVDAEYHEIAEGEPLSPRMVD